MISDPEKIINDEEKSEAKLQPEQMRAVIEKIELSGVLGRSKLYANLLGYLCEAYIEGVTPKEVVIAIDVMGKSSDFDVKNDSLVRVYMHKLRQKLSEYYSYHGKDDNYQISIPKGKYALVAHAQHMATDTSAEVVAESAPLSEPPGKVKPQRPPNYLLIGLLVTFSLLLAANLVFRGEGQVVSDEGEGPLYSLGQHPVWAPLLADDKPILVVIGDYYMFGEHTEGGDSSRLIREHHINSASELEQYKQSSEQAANFYNLNLTYLPRAIAFVMKDVLPVLTAAGKPLTIRMSSQIKGSDLKSQHVLYLGYISAMGELMSFAFQESSFTVGSSYDELVHKVTGEAHASSEKESANKRDAFYDYGMISTMPMLDGHQMMFISGTRDTGLMHMAHILSDKRYIDTMISSLEPNTHSGQPLSFEAVYRVIGYDGLNFDAEKIHVGALDYKRIWGGEMMDVLQSPATQ